MQIDNKEKTGMKLHQSLKLKDLVLLNISCIVGLTSLSQVAQFGYASMPLYILAIMMFLIPCGLMISELNSRMPEEGGLYLWTRTAFGDFHGYIAAWTYWLSNIVWLPTIVLLITISALYIFGDSWIVLSDDFWYNGLIGMGILWLVTALNIFGLEKAKWVQNIGGFATWLCIILLVIVGMIYSINYESGHTFTSSSLLPDFTDFSILPFFAIIAFSFGGLELAPLMSGEIKNPKRNIPRAILISSFVVGLIYILGTLMLIIILPEGEIGVIEGISQAYASVGVSLKIPWIGTIGAILVTLGTIGLFGAWMTGTARIPFVIGIDHYLPDVIGKIHPKWGSPYISLIMQGVVLSILFIMSIAGTTIKEGFLILYDMSIILYFIPFLYMFAALIWHIKRDTGNGGVITLFQNSRFAVWLVTVMGFGITLLSVIIATIPSKEIEDKGLFMVKVIGGAALLIGAGLIVYFLKRKKPYL